jgi:hypothetical protein
MMTSAAQHNRRSGGVGVPRGPCRPVDPKHSYAIYV